MLASSALPSFPIDVQSGPGIKVSRNGASTVVQVSEPPLPTAGTGATFIVQTATGKTALADGLVLNVCPNRDFEGAPLLKVDANAVVSWFDVDGSALPRVYGGRGYRIVYDATLGGFRLTGLVVASNASLSPAPALTVKANLTGATAQPQDVTLAAVAETTAFTSTGLAKPFLLKDRFTTPMDLTGDVIVGSPAAAANNSGAINAAMAFLNARNGGEIRLPAGTLYTAGTIDNRFDRILISGPGRDYTHDASGAGYGAIIVPTFSGDVLRHRTPSAAERGVSAGANWKTTGGGFRRLRVVGGTRAFHVSSVAYGIHDISVQNCIGSEAVLYDTLPDFNDPVNSQVAENSNNQKNQIRLDVRQDGSGGAGSDSCACVVFDGTVNCSNTSYNFNIDLDLVHKNGTGLAIKNADNNIFSSFRAYRVPGGTGQPVNVRAGLSGAPTEANTFLHYTSNAAGYVEGTVDRPGAILGGQIFIGYIDRSNGSIAPAGGADALIIIDSDLGISTGRALARGIIAGSVNEAAQARARQGSESLRLWSGGANHLILDDGTRTWAVNIDPATGDLRLLRTAGSGALLLGGGAPIKLGSLINAANDSAAASAGVVVGQAYRNGSALQVRVA